MAWVKGSNLRCVVLAAAWLAGAIQVELQAAEEPLFLRGDADSDGGVLLSDAFSILGWLFFGKGPPPCLDAADANDDGTVDASDALAVLAYLFLGAGEPPAPGPFCGSDPTPDALPLCSYAPACGPTALRLLTVEAAVGQNQVLVPLHADLYAPASGLRAVLLLPGAFQVDAGLLRLRGRHPGAETATRIEEGPPDGEGRPQRRVTVEVKRAVFPEGRGQELLSLEGRIAPEFSHAGAYPLRFEARPEVLARDGGPRPAEGLYDPAGGAQLRVHRRCVFVERRAGKAGDPLPIKVRVLATLDKPGGFERPEDYRIIAYGLHIEFNPAVLDLLPILRSDALETAAGETGRFFIPTGADFEAARRDGNVSMGWLGALGEKPGAILPGASQVLAVLHFRPKLPASARDAFARLELVKPPSRLPTQLIPEVVPDDGPVVEAFLDGGIEITAP